MHILAFTEREDTHQARDFLSLLIHARDPERKAEHRGERGWC